jgi:hypothetical protein
MITYVVKAMERGAWSGVSLTAAMKMANAGLFLFLILLQQSGLAQPQARESGQPHQISRVHAGNQDLSDEILESSDSRPLFNASSNQTPGLAADSQILRQPTPALEVLLVVGNGSDNVVQFDLATGRWTELVRLPEGTRPRGIAVGDTGEIFLGLDGGKMNVAQLVPGDGAVQLKDLTAPVGRYGPGMLVFSKGQVWAAGDTERVIHLINPATGEVSTPPQVRSPANLVGLVVDGETLYAAEYFQRSIVRYELGAEAKPLHESTLRQLRAYKKRRDRFLVQQPWRRPVNRIFVSTNGAPLTAHHAGRSFRMLTRRIGMRKAGASQNPRIHDLRHRFAISTILRWYRSGKNVELLLPVLSTYLGHVFITGTYWYLTCTPELMEAAGRRLESRWEGGSHAKG